MSDFTGFKSELLSWSFQTICKEDVFPVLKLKEILEKNGVLGSTRTYFRLYNEICQVNPLFRGFLLLEDVDQVLDSVKSFLKNGI